MRKLIVNNLKYIKQLTDACLESYGSHRLIGICGNGGSSAQAAHFAGEMVPEGIPTIAFNDATINSALINDRKSEDVYKIQVRTFRPLLSTIILLTTSGLSENIQEALKEIEYFNSNPFAPRIKTFVITGEKNTVQKDTNEYTLIKLRNRNTEDMYTEGIQEETLKLLHKVYRAVVKRVQ